MTVAPNPDPTSPGLPTGGRLVVQLIGFALGLLLVAWCIKGAIEGGEEGWRRLREADPVLIAGLLATSVLSQVANGALFWTTIRPVRREGFWVLQGVNFTSGLLNYAPVRIGMLSRFVYHLRVDRMPLLLLFAWFGTVAIAMMAVMGAALGATLLHPRLDAIWAGLFVAPLAALVLLLPTIVRIPVVARSLDRFIPGAVPMLTHRRWMSAGLALRAADLAMWVARVAIAARILGLELGTGDLLIIAVAALVVAMNPLGRIGFREAAVSILAGYLAEPTGGDSLDATFKQLAILDSVGEAAAVIPCGLVAAAWWYRRVRKAGPSNPGSDAADAPEA